MIEKRSRVRYRLKTPAETNVKAVFDARMMDISEEGALLEVDRLLPAGLNCSLRVRHCEEDVFLSGVIRQCRPGGTRLNFLNEVVPFYLAGLEFTPATRDSAQKLLSQIAPPPAEEGAVNGPREPSPDESEGRGMWIHEPGHSISVRVTEEANEPHPMVLPGGPKKS
jgi:hypothetical protein